MAILQRLFGPTDAQARQAELLKTQRRTNQQLQDSRFYDDLLAKGLVDPDNHIVDFEKLVSKDDNGMYLYENEIVALLNSSNKFRQFTDTKEGMDKLGVIEGFLDSKDGKTKTIVTRRPDTKALAPKTWFASDADDDLVANLSEKEFETLIQGNAAIAKYRAYPNLGPAVMAQSIARSGPKNLVTGEPLGDQEDIDDPVTEAGAVATAIDDDPDINLQEANAQLVSIGEDLQKRLEERKKRTPEVDTKDLSLPPATVNTTAPIVQDVSSFLETLTPESVLADSDIDLVVQGLTEGRFRKTWKAKWKRAQSNYDRNEARQEKAVKEREGRRYGVASAQRDKDYKSLKDKYLKEKEDLLNQVKENIKTDSASIEKAQADKETTKSLQIQNIKKQLENTNLTPTRKKELEDQLATLETPQQLTSVPDIEIQGELKPNATAEEVQTFFEANEESLKALSQDGDLVNRIRQVITDFGVEKKEDLKKIPFGTPEAKGVTALDTAIMFAAYDNQQNFSSALKDYISVLGTQATITKTQQTTAIELQNYYDSQNEKVASLNQTFLTAEENFINTVFDEDGDFKAFTPKDRALVSNLVNEVKGLPGAPGFEFKDGKYVITGEATQTVRDSLKGIAGVLFSQAVDQEGSVDFKDWFGDIFAPGDPQNIGNLIDNVRFRRVDPGDPNSPIAEIYFTPPGSEREAKGSLKPSNFTYRFGGPNENAYARNLILYYIQEYGIEERD